MKHENFGQCKNLVEQIDKHQNMLDNLIDYRTKRIEIIIKVITTLYTIDVANGSEHEYVQPARELIDHIIEDLALRIINLKSMLEKL